MAKKHFHKSSGWENVTTPDGEVVQVKRCTGCGAVSMDGKTWYADVETLLNEISNQQAPNKNTTDRARPHPQLTGGTR